MNIYICTDAQIHRDTVTYTYTHLYTSKFVAWVSALSKTVILHILLRNLMTLLLRNSV